MSVEIIEFLRSNRLELPIDKNLSAHASVVIPSYEKKLEIKKQRLKCGLQYYI